MNVEQLRAWMDSGDFIPCYLIEAQVNHLGQETTIYMSDVGYVTSPTDAPSNTTYVPAIAEVGAVTEKMAVNGRTSVGHGSITLENKDGFFDEYLEYVWDNRPLKIFLGDVSWPRAEFFQVFSGATESLNIRREDSLEILVRDRLSLLNGPVSEATTETTERVIPCAFGDVSNVPAMLVDPLTLTYQVHPGSVEAILEVRDNGVPVGFSPTPDTGKFQLQASPIGDVTAVVLGANAGGFSRDVEGLVRTLITQYGPEKGRAVAGEIDEVNFASFKATHPQCVGTYLAGRENILNVISQITSSVNSALVVSKSGQFRLTPFPLPEAAPPADILITEADIHADSFKPNTRESISPAVKLAYNRNYLPLQVVASGLPDAHRDVLQEEWKYASVSDQATADLYRMDAEPEARETTLQVTSEAEGMAGDILAMFGVQRYIYTLRCFWWMMPIQIGDLVRVQYPRFGFESGRNALVVGTKTAWSKGYIDIEVFV